jgi:hypothetical protein
MDQYAGTLKEAFAAADLMVAAFVGMPLDATTIAIIVIALGLLSSLYWTVVFLLRTHRDRLFERVDTSQPSYATLTLVPPREPVPAREQTVEALPMIAPALRQLPMLPVLQTPAPVALLAAPAAFPAPVEQPDAPVLVTPVRKEPVLADAVDQPESLRKRASLVILPFETPDDAATDAEAALLLLHNLALVLKKLCPELTLTPKPANSDEPNDAHLRLTLRANVNHIGNEIHLDTRLSDDAAGRELFHVRCRGLTKNQDVILAELTKRILRHVTPVLAEKIVPKPASVAALAPPQEEAMPFAAPLAANAEDRLLVAQ